MYIHKRGPEIDFREEKVKIQQREIWRCIHKPRNADKELEATRNGFFPRVFESRAALPTP